MSRVCLSRSHYGCTLPHELGIGDSSAGRVVVRKATPEELAELEKKVGPICPPEKAKLIRAKFRTLAGVRRQRGNSNGND